jgi:hypothetical protein
VTGGLGGIPATGGLSGGSGDWKSPAHCEVGLRRLGGGGGGGRRFTAGEVKYSRPRIFHEYANVGGGGRREGRLECERWGKKGERRERGGGMGARRGGRG